MKLNDPALVRREYADERRFAVRAAAWERSSGPDPRELAFRAVAEVRPERVLEVGSGRGELAERIRTDLGTDVVAIDQSERMVELTAARGITALVGTVEELPFPDASFDVALAAWMLYHVTDLAAGLAELRRVLRPGGRLVAVTNSARSLPELWGRFGSRAERVHPFSAENGAELLSRHFARVEKREARGSVRFESWDDARAYVAASTSRSHLADELEPFDGPLVASRRVAVFVAETSP